MSTFKKRLLVVSALLVGSLGLITIGFEEVERKEQFARDPQGNIMPSSAPGEAKIAELERKVMQDRQLRQELTQAKVEARVGSLPLDAQRNIVSYLERKQYVFWQTLNASASQLAFRDNEQNLVALSNSSAEAKIFVTVRSMKTGATVNKFSIDQAGSITLSTNGERIVALSHSFSQVDIWDTATGMKTTIALDLQYSFTRISAVSSDGTIVALTDNREIILFNTQTNTYTRVEKSYPFGFAIFCRNNEVFVNQFLDDIVCSNVSNGALIKKISLRYRQEPVRVAAMASNRNGTVLALSCFAEGNLPAGIIFVDLAQEGDFNPVQIITTEQTAFSLLFSHDNTKLIGLPAIFVGEGQVVIWNAENGKPMQRITVGGSLYGMTLDGVAMALSPDDKILAIGSEKNIQLWKKSTALQDALEKQQQVEEFRSSEAASSTLPSQIDKA